MTPAVDARGLRFAYDGGPPVLAGLDLLVAPGERVAVLGPNGAGKTTFALHLNGLLAGDGEVTIGGVRVEPATWQEVRARVGLVFQDPDDQLFMPTVAEDVAFGPLNFGVAPEEVERRVAAALAAVRLEDAAGRAPHRLSMGERRRAAIATVLAAEPDLLVLDEPSANLDPRSRRELVEILRELACTLLVVTHDLPLAAELCERAVVIDGGQVVADGPTAELLADTEMLAQHALELPYGFRL
jgi:cobalt/nickel transport system ATP-binding protein